jgi:hypothetical protein
MLCAPVAEGNYLVAITTHRDSLPPNGSSVLLTAYGKKGRSETVSLQKNRAGQESFQPGAVDEFEVGF